MAACSGEREFHFFHHRNSSETFQQFKSMVQETSNLREVLIESGNLLGMLSLGCDKGSIDIGGKFKSRSERWFGTRKK